MIFAFILVVEHLIIVLCDFLRQIQLFVDSIQVTVSHINVLILQGSCVDQLCFFFMIRVVATFHVPQLVMHIVK